MGKIIGIDLGTTNTVVAIYDDTAPRIVEPSSNSRTTPSIVGFTEDGDIVVGEKARDQQVTNPHNTVYSIKRFMGRRHGEVASEEKLVPYEIVGKPDEFVQVRVGRKKYTPQHISAFLLREIREMAEREMGQPVDRAIVTVPAYFNDAQRQATKDAAEIAGLTVERIINEPTAAALAYGMENRGERCVVVFDFGGGTFDLSAMRIGGGNFKVLAVHGNSHLGGDDFDQRIIDVVAEEFLRNERIDIRKDPMALQRLKQASQQAKAELSQCNETKILLPYVAIDPSGPKHLDYTITRERLEAICADLLEELRVACRKLMRDAELSSVDVDDVVLVGGSTRMPAVQAMAREVFKTESLERSINPDEVVALGAATLGGVLQGDLHNVNLMDVTSHSLGVEAANGIMQVLVPKDTPIPATIKKIFTTPADNQTAVPINVLEGESREAGDNRPIGVFRLTGIRRAPRGLPRIEVSFDIDANGILKVSATDLDTGRSQKIVVTGGFGLPEKELEKLKRETEREMEQEAAAQAAKSAGEGQGETRELRSHSEEVYRNMHQWLEYNAKLLPAKQIDQLESTLKKLRKRIDKNDLAGMRTYLKKLDDMKHIYRQAS